jgi:uncharacterized protein (DUF697 family)
MDFDSKLVNSAIIINGVAATEAASAMTLNGVMFGDDAAVTALTAGMILGLGKVHNKNYSMNKVLGWLVPNVGLFLGSRLAAMTVKWIPVIGGAANATISFTTTQVIGWTVYLIFKDNKDLDQVGSKELHIYKRRAQNMKKPDVEQWFKNMPKEKVSEYKSMVEKLGQDGLSQKEQDEILHNMQELVAPYADS